MALDVTVIGATGLVGKALVAQLIRCPHINKINVLVRRQVEYNNTNVTCHVIDFNKLAQYHQLLSGDILFSCLGTTKRQAGSLAAQRIVDVDYQYNAAKLAACNGVKRFVLVSSSGANHKSLSPYLKMKGELENKVKSLPFQQISILRPSLLLGQRKVLRVGEHLASHILSIVCRLPVFSRFKPISATQVAQKMLHVSLNQTSPFAIYSLEQLFDVNNT